MKLIHSALLAAALCTSAAANAQTVCSVGTATCTANSVCLSWVAPITRVSGANLPASELQGFVLSLDGKQFPMLSASTLSYVYPVPVDSTLTTTSVWSIAAVDTAGQMSDAFSCTNPKAVSGPKSKPSAPVLKVSAG